MGVTLSVEIGPDEEVPFWFTRTDSKALRSHLWELYWNNSNDELVRLLKHLDLSLEPFKKIGEEEEPLESFLERDPTKEREEYWYKKHAENEAAWQPPSVFIEALKPLLAALDDNRDIFSELEIAGDYFVEGFFRQDLLDLLKMFEWAQAEGASRVRLFQH